MPVSFNVRNIINIANHTIKLYYPSNVPANRTLIIDNSTALPPHTNLHYEYIATQFAAPEAEATKAENNNLIVQINQQPNSDHLCFTSVVANHQPVINNHVSFKDSVFIDTDVIAGIGFRGSMLNNHINATNLDNRYVETDDPGFLQLSGAALLDAPSGNMAIFNENSVNAKKIYAGGGAKKHRGVMMAGFYYNFTPDFSIAYPLTSQAHESLTRSIEIGNNAVVAADVNVCQDVPFTRIVGGYYNDIDTPATCKIITHHNKVIINEYFNVGLRSDTSTTLISGTLVKVKAFDEDHQNRLPVQASNNLVSLESGSDRIVADHVLFITGAEVNEASNAAYNKVIIKEGRFKGEVVHIKGALVMNSHLGYSISNNLVSLDGSIFRSNDLVIAGGYVVNDTTEPLELHASSRPAEIANNTVTISRCNLNHLKVSENRLFDPKLYKLYEPGKMGTGKSSSSRQQAPESDPDVMRANSIISGVIYHVGIPQPNSISTVDIMDNKVHFTGIIARDMNTIRKTNIPASPITISGASATNRIPHSMARNSVLIEEGWFLAPSCTYSDMENNDSMSMITGAATPIAPIIDGNFVQIKNGTFGGVDIVGAYATQNLAPETLDTLTTFNISNNYVQIAGGVFKRKSTISAVMSVSLFANVHDNFVKIINNQGLVMTEAAVIGACLVNPASGMDDLAHRMLNSRDNRLIIDSCNNTNRLSVSGVYLFDELHFILPPTLNSLTLLNLRDPMFSNEEGETLFEKAVAFSLYDQINSRHYYDQHPLLTVAKRLNLLVNGEPTDISLDSHRVSRVNVGDWIVLVDGSEQGIDHFEPKLDNGFLIFNFKSLDKDLILAVAVKDTINHEALKAFIDVKFKQDQKSRPTSATSSEYDKKVLGELLAYSKSKHSEGARGVPKRKSQAWQNLEATLHLTHSVKLSNPGALILSRDLQPNKRLAFKEEAKLDTNGLGPYPYNAHSEPYNHNLAPRTQVPHNNDVRIAIKN